MRAGSGTIGVMTLPIVLVPQWQGSGSPRRGLLPLGGEIVHDILGDQIVAEVSIPPYDAHTGTHVRDQLTDLIEIRHQISDAIACFDKPVITIGGDCGIELASVNAALERNPEMVLVWFDAHADLNTVESSPSGTFHGMVARSLLGDAPEGLETQRSIPPSRLILAGVRSLDDDEHHYIEGHAITRLSVEQLGIPEALLSALAKTDAQAVYLHIDVDVLDPAEITSLGFHEPHGLSYRDLEECVRAIRRNYRLAGAGITEFSPSSATEGHHDSPVVLGLIEAIQSGLR